MVLLVLDRRPSVSSSLMSGLSSTSFITSFPKAVQRSLRTARERGQFSLTDDATASSRMSSRSISSAQSSTKRLQTQWMARRPTARPQNVPLKQSFFSYATKSIKSGLHLAHWGGETIDPKFTQLLPTSASPQKSHAHSKWTLFKTREALGKLGRSPDLNESANGGASLYTHNIPNLVLSVCHLIAPWYTWLKNRSLPYHLKWCVVSILAQNGCHCNTQVGATATHWAWLRRVSPSSQ